MTSIALILLVFAFVLAAISALGISTEKFNLLAAAFACFMLALILGGVSAVLHIGGA